MLFIEICKCQISPYSREFRILFATALPMLCCYVILALVIVQASQVIVGLAGFFCIYCSSLQCQNVIYAVREAVAVICFFCFCQIFHIAIAIIIKVIICHRSCSPFFYRHLQNLLDIVRQSCGSIVESQFLIVVWHSVHKNLYLIIPPEFIEATIVEGVCL